ncbi:translation initiation factor IF-2-like [Pyrgilauda ruficollis]|uniref:translation initiation factor IF-2-like n=1 Tax=Pyrgilauda ruficollis TaxID=221976 RepID=UPI001B880CD8|nr:translation initiation factor IF-2-like [Pyrgilauda ruficollis]
MRSRGWGDGTTTQNGTRLGSPICASVSLSSFPRGVQSPPPKSGGQAGANALGRAPSALGAGRDGEPEHGESGAPTPNPAPQHKHGDPQPSGNGGRGNGGSRVGEEDTTRAARPPGSGCGTPALGSPCCRSQVSPQPGQVPLARMQVRGSMNKAGVAFLG